MEGDAGKGSGRAVSLANRGSWRVRLRRWDARGRGRVLGAGVLLGRDRVLTCAHVVEEDPVTHRRPERIQVELLRLEQTKRVQRYTATVMDGNWLPSFGADQGDLALLALLRPAPEPSPVTLFRASGWRGAPVEINGFPTHNDGGLWLTGTHRGPGGRSDEWDQIDLDHSGDRVLPGFSGAGVFLKNTNRVIGITVQADPNRRSYMIPTSILARYLPGVGPYVHGARTMSDEDAASPEDALTARPHALQRTVLRWLHADPADPDAWDVEVLFIGAGDERARQALRLLLTLADRERAPHLSVDPTRTTGGQRFSGAPLLTQAGIRPRLGSISLVLNLAGASFDPPGTASVREALEGLDEALAHTSGHGGRPTVAVLGADRSTSEPYVTAHRLHELAARGSRLLIVLETGDGGFPYEMARLLPLRRAADWLERIGRRVRALAQAEERAREVYERVKRHIADREPPREYTSQARTWLVRLALDTELPGAGPAPATYLERLSHGEQAVETALLRVERDERALRELLEEHARLLGMLRAFQARLARSGRGEHPDAVELFRRAQQSLLGEPVPLAAAAAAVQEFGEAVRRLTGEHPEGEEESGA